MPATALIQTDIDFDVKERAAAVFGEMGISVSDAVRIFLTRTADEGALPFTLTSDAEAHDRWFRAQVQEALDDPRPAIPNEEVKQIFARRRALLEHAGE